MEQAAHRADQSLVIEVPGTLEFGERIHSAKMAWEKTARTFTRSVSVLCRIIEAERERFPEEKLITVEAEIEANLVEHRASSRKHFAEALQSAVNIRHAEMIAVWWREVGIPATAHMGDSISRLNTDINDIIRSVTGLPPVLPELEADETAASPSAAVFETRQDHRVGANWFRGRMLYRATRQLKTDVEGSIDTLSRQLVEKIERRAANLRQALQCQLDQAFARATDFSDRRFVPPEAEYRQNPPLLFAAAKRVRHQMNEAPIE